MFHLQPRGLVLEAFGRFGWWGICISGSSITERLLGRERISGPNPRPRNFLNREKTAKGRANEGNSLNREPKDELAALAFPHPPSPSFGVTSPGSPAGEGAENGFRVHSAKRLPPLLKQWRDKSAFAGIRRDEKGIFASFACFAVEEF